MPSFKGREEKRKIIYLWSYAKCFRWFQSVLFPFTLRMQIKIAAHRAPWKQHCIVERPNFFLHIMYCIVWRTNAKLNGPEKKIMLDYKMHWCACCNLIVWQRNKNGPLGTDILDAKHWKCDIPIFSIFYIFHLLCPSWKNSVKTPTIGSVHWYTLVHWNLSLFSSEKNVLCDCPGSNRWCQCF